MRSETIVCPVCGREYLPGEIFTREFLGRPVDIIKNQDGKVVDYDGMAQDLESDTYYCDGCNTPFVVDAKVSYQTRVDSTKNTGEAYATVIKKKPTFNLPEN